MNVPHFKVYSRQDILSLTRIRKFETKLGEIINVLPANLSFPDAIEQLSCRYVIFGIPEDIGVRANNGTGSTSMGWLTFLRSFLNNQSNDFLSGEEVAVIGHFDFGDLQYVIDKNAPDSDEKLAAYRHAVTIIDNEVEGLVKRIVAAGKIPVVIGGGQNNAYPLIKGAAKGLHQLQRLPIPQLNAINLAPVSGFGPTEGRHSGNAFRYAEDDGFLSKYFMIGLQESFLPQNVWLDIVNNPFLDAITFEDLFIYEKQNFHQAVHEAFNFIGDDYFGIELHLGAVESKLSASTCGINAIQARQYVSLSAAQPKAGYLHISEGAVHTTNGDIQPPSMSLINHLVSDFIKVHAAYQPS